MLNKLDTTFLVKLVKIFYVIICFYKKFKNRPLQRKFFRGKDLFFKSFDPSIMCKNKIEDNNEKIFCRFGDTAFQKADFTVFDLRRDHPPTWELKTILAGS